MRKKIMIETILNSMSLDELKRMLRNNCRINIRRA